MTDSSYDRQMVDAISERLRVVLRLRSDAELSGATARDLAQHDVEVARVNRRLAKYRKLALVQA